MSEYDETLYSSRKKVEYFYYACDIHGAPHLYHDPRTYWETKYEDPHRPTCRTRRSRNSRKMRNWRKLWTHSSWSWSYEKNYWTWGMVGRYFRKITSWYMDLYYRIIRYLNRYISFTPEFEKKISREDFIASARKYLNYPYALGEDGSNKNTWIDCSHLISRSLIDEWCMNQYFYRTAEYLKSLTKEVPDTSLISSGDLLFLLDDTGKIGHVAIILEVIGKGKFKILDASWPSTGIWSTTIRTVDFSDSKYHVGSPLFLS